MSDEFEYFDELETRDPEQREDAQFRTLAEQLANAKANAPGFAEILKDIQPEDVRDRAALAKLPIIRKSELIERQKKRFEDRDPFGGLTAVKTGQLARIFASPETRARFIGLMSVPSSRAFSSRIFRKDGVPV